MKNINSSAIKQGRYFKSDMGNDPFKETLQGVKDSFQGKHVAKLFRGPVIKP